jgi:hypothetical protein
MFRRQHFGKSGKQNIDFFQKIPPLRAGRPVHSLSRLEAKNIRLATGIGKQAKLDSAD